MVPPKAESRAESGPDLGGVGDHVFSSDSAMPLPLRPLRAAARLLLPRLLSLHHPRIAGEIPRTLEPFTEIGIELQQRPCGSMTERFGLRA